MTQSMQFLMAPHFLDSIILYRIFKASFKATVSQCLSVPLTLMHSSQDQQGSFLSLEQVGMPDRSCPLLQESLHIFMKFSSIVFIKINFFIPKSTMALCIFMIVNLKTWRKAHAFVHGDQQPNRKEGACHVSGQSLILPVQSYCNPVLELVS